MNDNYKKFIEKYLSIVDKAGTLVPFRLNAVQDKYLTQDATGKDIILKARQMGFSSLILAQFLADFLYKKNTYNVVVADGTDNAQGLLKRVKDYLKCWAESHEMDIDKLLKYNSKYELYLESNNSTYHIGTAQNTQFGRSRTITNLHLCLHPNTPVMLHNGYYKDIKDITADDAIVNGDGYKVKPKALSIRKSGSKKFKKLSVFGTDRSVTASEDHRFAVYGEGGIVWKELKDITTKDYIAYPLRKIRGAIRSIDVIHSKNNIKKTGVLDADFALGRFIGWYLAEGTSIYGRNRITLTFDVSEQMVVRDVIAPVLPYVTSYKFKKRKDSKTMVVSLYGGNLQHAISRRFGYSKSKRIPANIYRYRRDFIRGLVKGYIEGDGHINDREVRICGIRENLIVTTARLISELGYGVPAVYKVAGGSRRGRNEKDQWVCGIFGECGERLRGDLGFYVKPLDKVKSLYIRKYTQKGFIQGWDHANYTRYAFRKVKSVKNAETPSQMYDIVLDTEPHSFITSVGMTHNSEGAFYPHLQEILAGAMQAVVPEGRVIIETTANGFNEFKTYWDKTINGETPFKGLFYPASVFYSQEFLAQKRGELGRLFVQEYPESALEAFVTSGECYFNTEALKDYLSLVKTPIKEGLIYV